MTKTFIRSKHSGEPVAVTMSAVGLALHGSDRLTHVGIRERNGTITILNGAFGLLVISPDTARVEGPGNADGFDADPIAVSLLWQGRLPAHLIDFDEGYYDALKLVGGEIEAGRFGPTRVAELKTEVRVGDIQEAVAALAAAGQTELAERLSTNLPEVARAAG